MKEKVLHLLKMGVSALLGACLLVATFLFVQSLEEWVQVRPLREQSQLRTETYERYWEVNSEARREVYEILVRQQEKAKAGEDVEPETVEYEGKIDEEKTLYVKATTDQGKATFEEWRVVEHGE